MGRPARAGTEAEVATELNIILSRYNPIDGTIPHNEFTSVGSIIEASFQSREAVKIEIEISLKSPTAAKDISDLADGINYRDRPRSELLFPAGTNFKLIAKYISPDGSGVWRILLEEL